MKKPLSCILAAVILLAGCRNRQDVSSSAAANNGAGVSYDSSAKDVGSILLKSTAEIRLSYDREGEVTAAEGVNENGSALLRRLQRSLVGEDAEDALEQLLREIYSAGFLKSEGDAIAIEIESGSLVPEQDFVTDIREELTETLSELGVSAVIELTDNSTNR